MLLRKWIPAVLVFLLTAGQAAAHMLWVNLYESKKHPPGHALVNIGWGHHLPMDDMVGSRWGRIELASYQMINPDMERTDFPVPVSQMQPVVTTPGGLTVKTGDMGTLKIPYTGKMAEGVYQVVTESKDNYYTMYLDVNGKQKMAMKSKKEIQDAGKILQSMRCNMSGKAFFAHGKWEEPKPAGLDLEVIPLDDLTNLRAGDTVSFAVTFKGEPVNTGMKGHYTMTLSSNSFGGPDGFFLGSHVHGGKASFRVPAAGQWVANIYLRQEVALEPDLSDMKSMCNSILYASSVSFAVTP